MLLLALSLLLLAAVSLGTARVLGRTFAERFWLAIAAALLQIGLVGQIASAVGQFTPAGVIATQAGILALGALAGRRVLSPASRPRVRDTLRDLDAPTLAIAAAAIVLISLSAVNRAFLLVGEVDDLNYHAARAAYWTQHRSVFPYDTHNERQTAFPYLGELIFAWGILFTKAEMAGKMLFWLVVPAAAGGAYTLTRALGAGRLASAGAALLLLSTPATLRLGLQLKADAWAAVPVMGAAFWAITAIGAPDAARRWAFSGVFLALAVAMKTTALALAPGLLALALLAPSAPAAARSVAALAAGSVVAMAASGALLLCVWNTALYQHPLGPGEVRRLVQPKLASKTIYVHLGRLPVYLLELPELPNEPARLAVERLGGALARSLGADRRLQGEGDGWPGIFQYRHAHTAQRFSTGGLLWLPVLIAASCGGAVAAARSFPRVRLPRPEALAVLQLPLFLGVVFLIRWMGAGPERFWFPAYALAVPLIGAVVAGWAASSRVVAAIAGLMLAWTAAAVFRAEAGRATLAQREAGRIAYGGAPLQAAGAIDGPARILVLGAQSTNDYLLFDPDRAFKNTLIPWGKGEFDPERMRRLIEQHGLTHVYIEHERGLGFMTAPTLRTRGVVKWLREMPGTTEIPLSPPARLFKLPAAGPDAPLGSIG